MSRACSTSGLPVPCNAPAASRVRPANNHGPNACGDRHRSGNRIGNAEALSDRDRAKVGEANLANIGAEAIATARALDTDTDWDNPATDNLSDSELLEALRATPMGRELAEQKREAALAAQARADQEKATLLEQARETIDNLTPGYVNEREAILADAYDLYSRVSALHHQLTRLVAARRMSIKAGTPLDIPEPLATMAARIDGKRIKDALSYADSAIAHLKEL